VQAVMARLEALTSPGETGEGESQRYAQALQENPETVFAHRDLVTLLRGNVRNERPDRE